MRQQTFPISFVWLFAYRLSDMDGYCFGNVRTEQTECTRTVRTRIWKWLLSYFATLPWLLRKYMHYGSSLFVEYLGYTLYGRKPSANATPH